MMLLKMEEMGKLLNQQGFAMLENVYAENEIDEIIALLKSKKVENKFGVREFLLNYPEIKNLIFTDSFIKLIKEISPDCNMSIKSIYFDKPPNANWVVNWHQDLTINLINKKETPHFKNWRITKERVVVQPSIKILERIFTIRIHLDDCTIENGALRVVDNSHKEGVIELNDENLNRTLKHTICEVKKGGVLIMKPLILHASKRTKNLQNRRVVHIEFIDRELPNGLIWKEKVEF